MFSLVSEESPRVDLPGQLAALAVLASAGRLIPPTDGVGWRKELVPRGRGGWPICLFNSELGFSKFLRANGEPVLPPA